MTNSPNKGVQRGTDWLVPQWPAPAGVRAVCTTRTGGVSLAPYDSLNLGSHVGDDPQHVQQNRAVLQQALGVRPVFMDQVHGTRMVELDYRAPNNWQADGCTTTETGVACTVMVADCLPILLCDAEGHRVAAVHAGWRGLVGRDGQGVVEQIFKGFAFDISKYDVPKVMAWLGPCIGPLAFEVGSEVRAAFVADQAQAAQCFVPLPGGKWLADLAALARLRLEALGVHSIYGNDSSAAWCTVGNPSRFFSYRRERFTGRLAACIWLE